MGNRSRGLFGKFIVKRADGTDEPGGKHDGCAYFVLDVTHDPNAIPALYAYAGAAYADGYHMLARDLWWQAFLAESKRHAYSLPAPARGTEEK